VNMKKSFPDKKGNKFREFLDKKGFYIVLLLCIAVVAGTAVYVTSRRSMDKTPEYESDNLVEGDTDDIASEDAALNTADKLTDLDPDEELVSRPGENETDIGSPASVTKDGELSGESEESSKKDTAPKDEEPGKGDSKKQSEPVKQSFIMPVNGEISFEYAMDRLVYSKTLEQWRVHPGIDIAADRGTPVKAVADGVVTDVRNDKFFGISVVIDHGDNLKTLYRNLASDETVAVNQKVKQGEIIGSIGNTAMDESSEQPHLHFEVLKNDVNEDPTAYLPIK
jgi:murein DD-endopeptidase MepM/ murein hydrolase activator NlpD